MQKGAKNYKEVFEGNKKELKKKLLLGNKIRVSRNRLTKTPDRIVEIDSYPKQLKKGKVALNKQNVELAFKEFLGEHKEVFEIEPENLKMVSAKKINKRWYVKYGQYYKGIPVHNATVGIDSAEDGRVSSYAANYHADIKLPKRPKVSLKKATDIALKTFKKKERDILDGKNAVLIIYPVKIEESIKYHLAWKFLVSGEKNDPEMEKFFIIDALDGSIIKSYNARFPGAQISGTVQGEIYPANPTDAISTVPLQNVNVDVHGAGQHVCSNSSGNFNKTVSWWWQLIFNPTGQATFSLDGPYARVQTLAGNVYTETRNCSPGNPCNLTWSATDRDHINVFYHMNLYHDWLENELGYSWINPWTNTSRFNAEVNDPRHNAWAGDPMTFGVNDFARSSDVIYHECTHNILYELYGDWIGFSVGSYCEGYAMDEGFSDYFASSFTNESRHGEGYSSSPRDLDNNLQYPGRASYNYEGHTGGTIIAGAAWILRQRLVNIYGASGARIADQLILQAHQILSTYPREYYFSDPRESNLLSALYRAADVDNNLLNSFPYFNDIQHAFHEHSLLQVVLHNRDSFDFSTNVLGTLGGGDLYYSGGSFWANNFNQKGVQDLGNIGDPDKTAITIPTTGYTRFGVNAVVGHTYISKAQQGEFGSYIVFRVTDISADQSTVTLEYFYRLSPYWYVANLSSKEIHKPNCNWVSLMSYRNKYQFRSLEKVADMIKNAGYNGCHYCLPRYDTDTKSLATVIQNLNNDIP